MFQQVWRVRDGSTRENRRKGNAGAKNAVEDEEQLEIYGAPREDI